MYGLMEFRLGNSEIFWDGNLELPCPRCHNVNLKTSDHSREICISCKFWFNWRFIAYRIFREQLEVENRAGQAQSASGQPQFQSEVWNPSEELRNVRPRARDIGSGRYVRTPKPIEDGGF